MINVDSILGSTFVAGDAGPAGWKEARAVIGSFPWHGLCGPRTLDALPTDDDRCLLMWFARQIFNVINMLLRTLPRRNGPCRLPSEVLFRKLMLPIRYCISKFRLHEPMDKSADPTQDQSHEPSDRLNYIRRQFEAHTPTSRPINVFLSLRKIFTPFLGPSSQRDFFVQVVPSSIDKCQSENGAERANQSDSRTRFELLMRLPAVQLVPHFLPTFKLFYKKSGTKNSFHGGK